MRVWKKRSEVKWLLMKFYRRSREDCYCLINKERSMIRMMQISLTRFRSRSVHLSLQSVSHEFKYVSQMCMIFIIDRSNESICMKCYIYLNCSHIDLLEFKRWKTDKWSLLSLTALDCDLCDRKLLLLVSIS